MENPNRCHRTPRRHHRSAFTLIELLVVVAVLALLVSIILPSYTRAQIQAKRTKCAANLHSLGLGMRMYLNDSRDIMPVVASMPSLKLNTDPRICDVLKTQIPDPVTWQCPADAKKNFFASEGSSYQYNTSLGGRKIGEGFLSRRIGENYTPVLYDYEPFHGKAGENGSTNYLFADMHVGDLK